ncbi:hypothetical protein C2G38_2231000 [Gigaspora rosea]|uniref:BTB domain-containing protein n=1 Tax=Gigaspora rosea TaxID=44941 RepID=A0A397TX88_9GLOM|nr:hypothetical protein C2G38_2231000 [Gigaspora rosea]
MSIYGCMSQISTKLLERFSNDFAQLLETEYESNVIVKVGKQSFKLLTLVLYQRSSFFRQELTTATKKNNIIEINLTDTSVGSFKILIKKCVGNSLKRDDLQIEELEIWDKIYGMIFPNAPISSTILPARKKISVQLPVREVNFLNPSSIINDEHFAEIYLGLIVVHRYIMLQKYLTNLIYCRDGFTCELFHRLCANISGGYNPLNWTTNNWGGWSETTDIFFSLKTQNLLNPSLVELLMQIAQLDVIAIIDQFSLIIS